jgi:hypothetical protein
VEDDRDGHIVADREYKGDCEKGVLGLIYVVIDEDDVKDGNTVLVKLIYDDLENDGEWDELRLTEFDLETDVEPV